MGAQLTLGAVDWASSLPIKGVLLIPCQDLTRHTDCTQNQTHTHRACFLSQAIFTSRPCYQNSLFPFRPFFFMWISMQWFFPSQQYDLAQFSSLFSQLAAEASRMNHRSSAQSLVIYWSSTTQSLIVVYSYISFYTYSRWQGRTGGKKWPWALIQTSPTERFTIYTPPRPAC